MKRNKCSPSYLYYSYFSSPCKVSCSCSRVSTPCRSKVGSRVKSTTDEACADSVPSVKIKSTFPSNKSITSSCLTRRIIWSSRGSWKMCIICHWQHLWTGFLRCWGRRLLETRRRGLKTRFLLWARCMPKTSMIPCMKALMSI